MNSGTDDPIHIKICDKISNQCCNAHLDNPEVNDFEKGQTDTFESIAFKGCETIQITVLPVVVPNVELRIDGTDGWLGKHLKIKLHNGQFIECPMTMETTGWLDDNGKKLLECKFQHEETPLVFKGAGICNVPG